MKKICKVVDKWMDVVVDKAVEMPMLGLFLVIIALLSVGLITSTVVSIKFSWIQAILAGTQVAWIGFYGSIIAGTLTLVGVRATIKHNGSMNSENHRLSQRPFFLLKDIKIASKRLSEIEVEKYRLRYFYTSAEKEPNGFYNIICAFKNVGLEAAIDIQMLPRYGEREFEVSCDNNTFKIIGCEKGEEIYEINNLQIKSKQDIVKTIVIKYKDITGQHRYKQSFTIKTLNNLSRCELSEMHGPTLIEEKTYS